MSSETLLALSLIIPSLGAVLIAVTGRYPNLRESVTLVTATSLALTTFSLLPRVLAGERPELELLAFLPGLELKLAVEPLGMLFAGIATLLWPINSVYSIGYMRGNSEKHQTRFYVCFAIALASAVGIAFSGNLLTMFIFYEVLSLSTYPLVAHKGTPDAVKGARTYIGILLATSIGLFLLGILWVWSVTGTTDFRTGGILGGHFEGALLGLLLFLFMYGIGKAALMPIHRWLPSAMVAPTPVSALLHAVAVVKAGVFCVVKVIVYVFGLDALAGAASGQWLLYAAGFTLLVASVVALRQDNLKRRLAYSTVSQLSYVVMAAALFHPLAMVGAALHIAAHAFGKITLFFAAGSIYTAAHKTEISQLDGIGRRMPWTMGAFAIGAVSMIGLPPAAGFVSKWYMLVGASASEQWLAVGVITVSTLLNAAYFLPIIYAAFMREPQAVDGHHHETHGEAPLPIVIALTATAVLTVLTFLFPAVPLQLAQQMMEMRP